MKIIETADRTEAVVERVHIQLELLGNRRGFIERAGAVERQRRSVQVGLVHGRDRIQPVSDFSVMLSERFAVTTPCTPVEVDDENSGDPPYWQNLQADT